MKKIELADNIKNESVLALGSFDSLHRGHMMLLLRAVEVGEEKGYSSFLYSIEIQRHGRLLSAGEKEDLLYSTQLSGFISEELDDIRDLSPEEFVDRLISLFGAKYLICGYNFTFGKGKSGDAALLSRLCREKGIGCEIVPELRSEECSCSVSSSAIRSALLSGNIEDATELLGRNYGLSAKIADISPEGVIKLMPEENKIIPSDGRYTVYTNLSGYFSLIKLTVREGALYTDPGYREPCKTGETAVVTFV